MENPDTWGEAERIVNSVIEGHEGRDIGLSIVRQITDALRDADLLFPVGVKENEVYEALAFYANPDNYFAIAIWPDRPAGEFADDFSMADHLAVYGEYERKMPGKLARTVLGLELCSSPECVLLVRHEGPCMPKFGVKIEEPPESVIQDASDAFGATDV